MAFFSDKITKCIQKRKVANSTRTCNLKPLKPLKPLQPFKPLQPLKPFKLLQLYLYAPPKTFFNKSLVRAARLVRMFTSSLATKSKSALVARSVT